MKLSIVTTLYYSAPYIADFHLRISAAAQEVAGDDYEIILVNDGSPDESLQRAIALTETDPHVIVVDLSRNFGHHKAIMTGLRQATGEYIFSIDIDLEEPPELLIEFWERMEQRPDIDVIYGFQEHRKGGWFERWSGQAFYRMMSFLSSEKIPKNCASSLLMTKRYVSCLTQHGEKELFMLGLIASTGFKREGIKILKNDKGSSTYSLKKKLGLMLNAVTGFSNKPLYFIFGFGSIVSAFSFILAAWYFILYLYQETGVSGFTTLVISIWLTCGLLMLSIGMVGIYIAKIFTEVKNRPITMIREVYRKKE